MKIYEYGISAVYDGEAVEAQMLAGHRYRNELVAIERQRREAYSAIMAEHVAREGDLIERLAATEAAIDARRTELKRANAATRSKGDKAEAQAAIKALREEAKALRGEIREAKARLRENEDVQAQVAEVNEAAAQAVRDARAATPTFWGTYLHFEAAVQAAKKKPTPPKFHRWDGSGVVSVQIQGHMTTEEVYGQDTRVRVEPVDPRAWDDSVPRGERTRLCRTTLSLRIGSQGRDPIWARFRLHVHRPLPPGRVKWVKVFRRRIASNYRWVAQFTVDEQPQHLPAAKWGPVAIDLGWRIVDGGLRVATAVDEAGQVDYLILPDAILDRIRRVDSLRAIRDRNFNEARDLLAGWLKTTREVPEWLLETCEHVAQWRSINRLAGLVLRWADNRFPGDEEIFAQLEAWRCWAGDKHLWHWEANLRDKVLRRRRDLYRCWAKRIAETYGTVILEAFDLRQLQRHAAPEDEKGESQAHRLNQRVAAVSELREALEYAVKRQGGEVVKLNPAWSTKACHNCGVIAEGWDPGRQVRHQCSHCGAAWDQDVNACRNLLRGSSVEMVEA
ncbi:MAG: zinc ribbon domain-containing protein [Vulcanimicrobiota bacterium]